MPPPPAEPRARALSKTMVGFAPGPATEPTPNDATPAPQPTHAHSLAQTTLGLGLDPIDVQFESQAQPPAKTARFSGTMIGLPARAGDPGARPAPGNSGRPLGGTLLGVARPGIAPTGDVLPPDARGFSTTPGMAGSPFLQADSSAPPLARESTPPGSQRLSASPPTRAKAIWFLVGILGAAALGAGIAWLTRPGFSVRVSRFETTAEGGDFIVLECKECPPQASIRIGNATAVLKAGQARLSAGRKLAVGQNQLDLLVAAPGNEPEKTSISVPVAFRVDTSLKELMTENPRALVQVSAPADARVQIQGQPVPLSRGIATLEVPLGPERAGFSDVAEHVEKIVPIIVEREGRPKTTEARVSAWVVPLHLSSPADGHVLSGGPVTVSGRTVKNAKLNVGNLDVEADLEGEFSVVIDKPTPGPLTIRAREGQSIGRSGTITFSSEETRSAELVPFVSWKSGASVRLEGTVVETRPGHGTRVVLDVFDACGTPPCLASVAYGEPVGLEPGSRVTATGTIISATPPRLLASSLGASSKNSSDQRKKTR